MNPDIFLWPQGQPLRLAHWLGRPVGCAVVEARLGELYPAAEPVLFSSGRAGLRAVIAHLGLGRPDLVWCPPFSSHCVFDAVSRLVTPTTLAADGVRAALVYHQWGHVHDQHFATGTEIIEDAVDTLFVPGDSPFSAGGRFALWSLPKVLACRWGGVVFCRDREDAAQLRRGRDAVPLPPRLQAWLRLAGERFPQAAAYWHGAESGGGRLPAFALRHIADALDRLPGEVAARRLRLEALQTFSLAPPPRHLPSNLPFPADPAFAAPLPSGARLSAGLRSFNLDRRAPDGRWERVFPIPIHQDISGMDIAEIVARANSVQRFQHK